MKLLQTTIGLIACMLTVSWAPLAQAIDIPVNDGYITDAANLLSDGQEELLENQLKLLQNDHDIQFVIVLVQNIEDAQVHEAANAMRDAWSIGTSAEYGALLLVSYKNRDYAFSLIGDSLLQSPVIRNGILDQDFLPHVRNGDYASGLFAVTDSIFKHANGQYSQDRYAKQAKPENTILLYFFFISGIIFQFCIALLVRHPYWYATVFGIIFAVISMAIFGAWIVSSIFLLLGLFLDAVLFRTYKKPRQPRASIIRNHGWHK